jgi:hypothetical protein
MAIITRRILEYKTDEEIDLNEIWNSIEEDDPLPDEIAALEEAKLNDDGYRISDEELRAKYGL